MVSTAELVMEQALTLPIRDRALIARQLLLSLEGENDPEAEALWQEELQRRLGELQSGQVACISWTEARERIAGRLRAPS
ncbi:MAG: addiction module protein [Magnetococcales bacterium]|nr:addiction module protein [Magnetococcales bacterium]MBF0155797.1 addiction module protein [Magnetococcales bacterium]